MSDKVLLPWWQESAFQTFVKRTGVTLSAAVIAISAKAAPWDTTLLVAGGAVVADFLISAYDIFIGGPVTYTDPTPPDPLAALKAEFDAYKAAHP